MKQEPEVTIVLLNYKRPRNISTIVERIRAQTQPSVIFLWNNGPDDLSVEGIDYYQHAPRNAGCMARWRMARSAETRFVMSLDDDLCFARDDVLENVLTSLKSQDDANRIVGGFGCKLPLLPLYTLGRHVRADNKSGNEDTPVDIIKGRAMAFRRELLSAIHLPDEREDDIYLSALFAAKRRNFHRIPQSLVDAFEELPDYGEGNCQQSTHYSSRDRASASYFCQNSALAWACEEIGRVYAQAKRLTRNVRKTFQRN